MGDTMITLQQQQKVAAACIKACNIGNVEVVYDPAQGDTGALVIDGWLFIEKCTVPAKTITGMVNGAAWRLYRIRVQNNYPHAPDDAWDETVWETRSFDDVVKHALIEYVRVMVDQREPTDEEVAEFDRTHALPEQFSLPIKHGLREHGYIDEINGVNWAITPCAAIVEAP